MGVANLLNTFAWRSFATNANTLKAEDHNRIILFIFHFWSVFSATVRTIDLEAEERNG